MFLRLKSASIDPDDDLDIYKCARISGDVCGNEIETSYELAKGYYTKFHYRNFNLPEELVESQKDLISKRNLKLIMKLEIINTPQISIGEGELILSKVLVIREDHVKKQQLFLMLTIIQGQYR